MVTKPNKFESGDQLIDLLSPKHEKTVKYCPKCKIEKSVNDFYVDRHSPDGYTTACKACRKAYMDGRKDLQKEYREQNREKLLEGKKQYRERSKDKIRAYNAEYVKRDYVKKRANKHIVEKYNNDELFRLKMCVRSEIRSGFTRKGFTKSETTEELVGCTLEEFIGHLKATYFQNYGVEYDGTQKVHIDHIIPIATAKTEEEVKKLCHWSNLQLLNAEDNLEKSDSLDWRLHFEKEQGTTESV